METWTPAGAVFPAARLPLLSLSTPPKVAVLLSDHRTYSSTRHSTRWYERFPGCGEYAPLEKEMKTAIPVRSTRNKRIILLCKKKGYNSTYSLGTSLENSIKWSNSKEKGILACSRQVLRSRKEYL
jgi:phage terminase large subunit GpA-like protein